MSLSPLQRFVAVSLLGIMTSGLGAAQQPVFRASVDAVEVNVSVRAGNRIVANLTAADFSLSDNGVPQQIEAVAIESVPIDVTVIVDTSGSTAGMADKLRKDVQQMAALLRPTDRFRLLSIDTYVHQLLPLAAAADLGRFEVPRQEGSSSVHDALLAALTRRVEAGRRHLVIGMTDGVDTMSVTPAVQVAAVAARSDALLHLVIVRPPPPGQQPFVSPVRLPYMEQELTALEQAAEATGGELHASTFPWARDPVQAFKKVFDDFRQSYVLRYSAQGVEPHGWHKLTVTVPKARYSVRARAGYFAGR